MQVSHGRGSVHLWQHCDTIFTFSFLNDVTFSHNVCIVLRCITEAESDVYDCLISVGVEVEQKFLVRLHHHCVACRYTATSSRTS